MAEQDDRTAMETAETTGPDAADATLVRAAREGDATALGTLLTRNRPLLLSLAFGALGDAGLAEDAVQEAALQAMLGLDRLRNPDRFGAWLAGICLNVCRGWLRRRARDAWSWEAMLGGRLVAEPIDDAPGPAEQVEAAEERGWLRGAITTLSPGQQAAVTLHYLAGLTQAEAAAVLGVEVGAVKTRLHKARSGLRRRLLDAGWDAPQRTGGRTMIEMRVVDVRRLGSDGERPIRHVALLAEAGDERRLPIWIGESEATAMALHLAGVATPRPLTYAFAVGVLEAAGGRLREVRIERLDGEVFYASAVVTGPTGERTVDARPSDALNLALLVGAPIRVDPAVLTAAETASAEWGRPDEAGEGAAAIAVDVVAKWEAIGTPRPQPGGSAGASKESEPAA